MVCEAAAPEDAAPEEADAPSRRSGLPWGPLAGVALTVAVLAPVISVVGQRAGRPYLPMQDSAVMDLRLRDVFTFSRDTPLVGAYSHFGWNHPGPAIFYLVAPFARLFGDAAWATLVGFALLQAVAIVWTARLAWKTGGLRWVAVWMAIMALVYVGAGPAVLQVAWNPSVALPYFVLFLLQCRVVAGGEARRLLGLAFVASFLVQAHIGYAILVVVLGGWALVRVALQLRARRAWPQPLILISASVVLVLLWLPPLVLDPVVNGSSNVARLVHFYLHPSARFPHAGVGTGLGYLATEFRWLPPWVGGSQPVNLILRQDALPSAVGWLAIPVVLVGLAWWSARRTGRRELALLAEMVVLLLVASAISLSLVQGERSLYLFYWRVVAGAASVVLCATILVDSAAGSRWGRRAGGVWASILAAAAVLAALSVAPASGDGGGPQSGLEPAAAVILAQLRQQGQPDGSAIVRGWGSTTGGLAASLVDQLSREGKAVYVDRTLGFELGYGRTAGPTNVRWVLYVTESSAVFNVGRRIQGATVVARTYPLPPDQEADLARLQADLLDQLKAHHAAGDAEDLGSPYVQLELARVPGLDRSELQQLAGLNAAVARHGCLCGVIEFAADPGLTYYPDYMASYVRGGAAGLSAR